VSCIPINLPGKNGLAGGNEKKGHTPKKLRRCRKKKKPSTGGNTKKGRLDTVRRKLNRDPKEVVNDEGKKGKTVRAEGENWGFNAKSQQGERHEKCTQSLTKVCSPEHTWRGPGNSEKGGRGDDHVCEPSRRAQTCVKGKTATGRVVTTPVGSSTLRRTVDSKKSYMITNRAELPGTKNRKPTVNRTQENAGGGGGRKKEKIPQWRGAIHLKNG